MYADPPENGRHLRLHPQDCHVMILEARGSALGKSSQWRSSFLAREAELGIGAPFSINVVVPIE